ncbi:uncharacterized protein [Trachinotus anak]|uniref:uncharacterized protein n=1 Tax=Trachinotus anak TaxID=443729 RepID=UPI0039F1DBF4
MKNLLQNINEEQGKKSTAANNSTEHRPLMESKDLKKMEELKKKDMKQMIDFLVTLNKDLKKQKEQQTSLMCEAERRAEETEKKVKSVEAEVTAKEGDKTVNKAQGYLKLKEILDEGNLEEIKKGYQDLQVNTDRLIKKTCDEIKSAAEKNELEDYLKKIEQQHQDTGQEKQKEQLPVKEQKSETEKEESQRKVQPHSGGKEQDKGKSNLICSSEPVAALAGSDVILPCRLEPPISASSRTVEWTRPGLDPEYIHVHQDGRLVYQSQNPLYNYRTALFVDQLINGNVSLKLLNVKISDAGRYKCFLPWLWKEAFIQLGVGAVSSPVISLKGTEKATSGVILECESKGWYPEPEVLWLDGEGKLLPAGPTETVRGPDGLYTPTKAGIVGSKGKETTHISSPDSEDSNSRVIVNELNGNSFCLSNTTSENQLLSNWRVHIEFSNTSYKYRFIDFTLEAGKMVTIWASDGGGNHNPPTHIVWKEQKSWGTRDLLRATLTSPMGEKMNVKTFSRP